MMFVYFPEKGLLKKLFYVGWESWITIPKIIMLILKNVPDELTETLSRGFFFMGETIACLHSISGGRWIEVIGVSAPRFSD